MYRRPRIGFNCDVVDDPGPRARVACAYLDYLAGVGALPVIIPPVSEAVELLADVDGMVFIGGDDYRMGTENGTPPDFDPIHPRRETHDFELARRTLAVDLPVLGICGGFQLLALASGARLIGDLPSERPASPVLHRRRRPTDPPAGHGLEWPARCPVTGIDAGHYQVNSFHHQALREIPSGWQLLASAPDGVIEAARGPGRFQVGVQWHPEREAGSPLNQALARALVRAAAVGVGARVGERAAGPSR